MSKKRNKKHTKQDKRKSKLGPTPIKDALMQLLNQQAGKSFGIKILQLHWDLTMQQEKI